MIISDVDICNLALDHLNQANITSLDEGSKSSKKCKFWYDVVRKSLLMNINASFSIKRAVLAEVVNFVPIYGYEKAYALPDDCLQVLNLESPLNDEFYQIEGNYFYCNKQNNNLHIRYIADIKDVSVFDAEFVNLFSLALAEVLCVPLTEDLEKRNFLRQLRKEKYIECSTKYGRDNRITVINKPGYRGAKIFPYILSSNYPLR